MAGSSSLRELDHGVDASHPKRFKVFDIASEQGMAGVLGQGGNGHIGKTRMPAQGDCFIGQLPRQPGRCRIQGENPLAKANARFG